ALRLARRWFDEGLVGPDTPEGEERIIVVNLSGRGDKDVATAAAWFGLGQADAEKDPLEELTPGEEQ
ncbi:tryptophan synthase subunit beta, partial [Micrococcus endophyticus]